MPDLKACACPLCGAEAMRREWEIRSEVRCVTCGHYSITHETAKELDGLSRAARAVVGDAMRVHLRALRLFNAEVIPWVLAEDVRKAAGRTA